MAEIQNLKVGQSSQRGSIADLVRGRTTEDAMVILEHTPRKGAITLSKTISSAEANAINNHNYQKGSLFVSEINVGPGLRMKRFQPAAHGRAQPFQRVSSNITVLVVGKLKAAKKASKKAETKNKTEDTSKSDKEETKTEAKKEEK